MAHILPPAPYYARMLKVLNLRSTLAVFCLASMSALHAGDPVHEERNRIANPGFESGRSDWKLFIAPQSQTGPSQEPLFEVVEDNKHGGNASARTNSETGERYSLKADGPALEVTAGQRYHVSAWVRFGDDARLVKNLPGAYVRLTLSQADGKDIKDPLLHIHICVNGKIFRSPLFSKGRANIYQLPSGWQKLEGVIEIPASAKSVTPELYVHGVTGSVNWDDIEMVEVASSAPLSKIISE